MGKQRRKVSVQATSRSAAESVSGQSAQSAPTQLMKFKVLAQTSDFMMGKKVVTLEIDGDELLELLQAKISDLTSRGVASIVHNSEFYVLQATDILDGIMFKDNPKELQPLSDFLQKIGRKSLMGKHKELPLTNESEDITINSSNQKKRKRKKESNSNFSKEKVIDEEEEDVVMIKEKKKNTKKKKKQVVSWKVDTKKESTAYTDQAKKVVGEKDHTPKEKHNVGFISQFPSTPGDLKNDAASRYAAGGFDNPDKNTSAERYRASVGVNRYRKVEDDSAEKMVKEAVTGESRKEGARTALIGFVWEPLWIKNVDGIFTDDIKASEVTDDEDFEMGQMGQILKAQKKATDATVIPYGRLRDHVFKHAYTNALIKELQKNNKTVYMHIADADVKQVRLDSAEEFSTGKSESSNEESKQEDKKVNSTGLFTRYEQLILEFVKSGKGPVPDLVSGGYEFQMPKFGESDFGKVKISTVYAQQLDELVRAKMAEELGALGVYFPEPNTLVKFTSEIKDDFFTSDISDGGGTQEGASMVMELFKKNPDLVALYDKRARIATRISPRFTEMQRDIQSSDTISYSDLKAIIGQNQSSAGRPNWVHNVSRWMYMKHYAANEIENNKFGKMRGMTWYHKIADRVHASVVLSHPFARKSPDKLTGEQMSARWKRIVANNQVVNLSIGDSIGGLNKFHKAFLKTEIGKLVIKAAYETDKVINAGLVQIYQGNKTKFYGHGDDLFDSTKQSKEKKEKSSPMLIGDELKEDLSSTDSSDESENQDFYKGESLTVGVDGVRLYRYDPEANKINQWNKVRGKFIVTRDTSSDATYVPIQDPFSEDRSDDEVFTIHSILPKPTCYFLVSDFI